MQVTHVFLQLSQLSLRFVNQLVFNFNLLSQSGNGVIRGGTCFVSYTFRLLVDLFADDKELLQRIHGFSVVVIIISVHVFGRLGLKVMRFCLRWTIR